jgi:hypothetical protein
MPSKLATVLTLALALAGCGGETDDGVGGTGGSGAAGGAGGASYSDCTRSSECVVVPASCCGSCGAAARGDAIGLNRDRVAAYSSSVCGGDGCPACYQAPDPTLVAPCRAGTCAVVDLREHSSTECTADAECHVRTSSCCECGGDMNALVAVSDASAYGALVCDPDQACGECAPIYPPEVTARCADGVCTVVDPRLP